MYENQQKEILQETSDSVCDGSIAYRAFTGSFSGPGLPWRKNAGGWIPEGRAGHARVTESNGSVDSSEILEEVWDEEEPEGGSGNSL